MMFTEFDVVVCVILLISSIAALFRGITKDVLSLVSYVGSAGVTLVFYPYAVSLAEQYVFYPTIISIVAVIVVFILSLTFFSAITAMLMDNLREFHSGFFDRLLGLCFGFIKGLAIVSAIHYIFILVADEEPAWLKNGETYKYTKQGADIIDDWIGDYFKGEEEKPESEIDPEEVVEEVEEVLDEELTVD